MTTPAEVCPANDETWAAFERFRDSIVGKPVCYGPGRGLWGGDKFIIGYSPGQKSTADHLKVWPNIAGKLYPALHCTSFTNLFLSWLLRRNDQFTHGGNIPDLPVLLATTTELTVKPNVGSWRGFRGTCTQVKPDGTGAKRLGFPARIDAKELLARARAGSLPTFLVFSQSTKIKIDWNRDHHTGLYVAREGRLYRIAADGYKGADGRYSATPMQWHEITDKNVSAFAAAAYRVWGVDTADGSYGDQGKAIAAVDFEAF